MATLLRAHRIPFAVIGAVAMAVHGVIRSTLDIDLLTLDARCLASEFWTPLDPFGISTQVRRGDDDDPLAGVVRMRATSGPSVDLVVGRAAWQHHVLERARETPVEGVSVPVASRVDVILLKLYAGGPQDAWDVEQLLASADRPVVTREVEAELSALPPESRRLWARIHELGGGS